jgi:hypothetical protein
MALIKRILLCVSSRCSDESEECEGDRVDWNKDRVIREGWGVWQGERASLELKPLSSAKYSFSLNVKQIMPFSFSPIVKQIMPFSFSLNVKQIMPFARFRESR